MYTHNHREELGNFLQKAAENGTNIVVVFLANLQPYNPSGQFQSPLIPKESNDINYPGWRLLFQDHLLFKDNPTITKGSSFYRPLNSLNTVGKVQMVAQWNDGVPLVAVRYDLKGLITSCGFEIGSIGCQDGI